MANLKISELPIITSALGSDVLPVVQSSTTNQISYSAFTIAAKLVGGETGNTVTEQQSVVVGGNFNQITGDTSNFGDVIAGGDFNNIFDCGTAFIGGGSENTIRSGRGAIIGGNQNNVKIAAQYGAIFGGTGNSIEQTTFGVIIGGENNVISGDTNITDTYEYSIISSFGSTISSTGSNNAILNGYSSVIPDPLTKVVMVGTNTRTADTSSTTYVENLKTFGQSYSNGTNVTGSTITIDFNTGNIHHIEVTGNLDLTLDNVKNGGRYVIITTTTGSFNINSKTAAGFTFKTDSGFNNLGNTTSHKLQLDVIGDVIYGTHSANLS